MWYHLSLFLEPGELGLAYAGITTATALSQVLGGPLAAALLLLDGTWGLHGWQWLFLCEGLPTIAFGVVLKVRCCPVHVQPALHEALFFFSCHCMYNCFAHRSNKQLVQDFSGTSKVPKLHVRAANAHSLVWCACR